MDKIKIIEEKDNEWTIEKKSKTLHMDRPMNLKKIAEKYAMCDWDPESKLPMRILLKSELDKYGVIWFQSPKTIQICINFHNEEMMKTIRATVIKIIHETMTPSIWEKFLRKIGKDREELRRDAREVRKDYIRVKEKIKGAVK